MLLHHAPAPAGPGALLPASRAPAPQQYCTACLYCLYRSALNGYTVYMLQAMSAPKVIGEQPQYNDSPGGFEMGAGGCEKSVSM